MMGHLKNIYGLAGHRALRTNKDKYERSMSKNERKVELLELIYSDEPKLKYKFSKKK